MLCTKQEATIRTEYGEMGWFGIGKGVRQGCILSLCSFNLYGEYIMRKSNLDDLKAGVGIGGRRINNLRYTDDTTLLAKSKENLMKLLQTVRKESEKSDLNLNLRQTKILSPEKTNVCSNWEMIRWK